MDLRARKHQLLFESSVSRLEVPFSNRVYVVLRKFINRVAKDQDDYLGMVSPLSIEEDLIVALEEVLSKHYVKTGNTFYKLFELEQKGLQRKAVISNLFKMKMLEYVTEESIKKAAIIAGTTLNQISNVISRNIIEDNGIGAIVNDLRKLGKTFTRSRARTIARTETAQAANYASNQTAKIHGDKFGITFMKQWVSSSGEGTRDEHAEADGQTIAMDELFNVGGEQLRYPGDTNGSPENIINCRCSVMHVPQV